MRPLPEIMRPHTMDDFIGQDSIWHPGSPLRKLVEDNKFHALLFWGPPGTGKTSLAQVIASTSNSQLVSLSAVSSGVKDIRKAISDSEFAIEQGQAPFLLFMDEIHRLSKSQQDVLLPALETGSIRFIGATTENPSFEVNKAILSRLLVFQLKPIEQKDLNQLLKRAHQQVRPELKVDDDVFNAIAESSGGDARKALNLLSAVFSATKAEDGIKLEDLRPFSEQLVRNYDKNGESHYDVVSAFIKAIRASHPDAALHYLAKMIDGGEKPSFIARRLLIAASEDIGNANPNALVVATSGMQAVNMLGYPEARIILSQLTTYLAASPKSNASYLAIDSALSDIKKYPGCEVPLHLRNAPTQFMKNIGYGQNYIYPHDHPEDAKRSTYLPPVLKGRRYYHPKEIGVEKQLKENLTRFRPIAD